MKKMLDSTKGCISFKAPQVMSGPQVHRLKTEVLKVLGKDAEEIVIDFSEVGYIDLHGLVLFKDVCDLMRTAGKKAYAYMLQPQMRELLAEVDLLAETESEESERYMIKTA